ncbi:MAG: AGCS family alanine or glycine:cation symporter, partial [Candidatus Marinamargulisbacteria bacterium]
FLFGHKSIKVCQTMFVIFIFIGGVISLDTVISLADILFMMMSVPNLLGAYLLSGKLKKEVDKYIAKYV